MKVVKGENLYGLMETFKMLKVNHLHAIKLLEDRGWLCRSPWVSNRNLKSGELGKGKLLPTPKYENKYFVCHRTGGDIILQTYVTSRGVRAIKYLLLAEDLIKDE